MAITPLPTPVPQTSDPINFNTRADAFMTALPTFATEANALQVDVNSKQALASTSQTNAATSETNAAASAAAAVAASNATIWVTGTTYAVGDCRFSPVDFRTYRRKTAGAGTTDPSLDQTNWQILTGVPYPFLHVRDEKTSATNAGDTINGTQTRTLNTVVFNTISGASVASSLVTLPAGTYDVEISAPMASQTHKASLYNNTDSTNILVGTSEISTQPPSPTIQSRSWITGRFTISATKVVKVNHYTNIATTTGFGLGTAVAAPSLNEVYTEAKFWKVG